MAGLGYGFSAHQLGLTAYVGGYNDKLDVLLHRLLERTKNLEVNSERLEVIKEQVSNERLSESYFTMVFVNNDYTDQTIIGELLFGPDLLSFRLLRGLPFVKWSIHTLRNNRHYPRWVLGIKERGLI